MEEQKSNLKSGASRWQEKVQQAKKEKAPTTDGKDGGLRGTAILLWVIAFSLELCGAVLFSKASVGGFYLWGGILAILLDLLILIWGSSLWKKANRKNPVTKDDSRFWFHHQLNRVMGSLAFAPFCLLVIFQSGTDAKGKTFSFLAGVVSLALFLLLLFL